MEDDLWWLADEFKGAGDRSETEPGDASPSAIAVDEDSQANVNNDPPHYTREAKGKQKAQPASLPKETRSVKMEVDEEVPASLDDDSSHSTRKAKGKQ